MDRTLSLLVKFAALDKLTRPLRAMGGGAKATARDLAATRREVLGLEKAAAKTGAFEDLRGEITKTHEQMDVARRRVTALKAAIAQASGPTGRLAQQLGAAERKVARLSETSQQQVGRLDALGRELRDAGVDTSHLAREQDRLSHSLADANRRLAEQSAQQRRVAATSRRLEAVSQTGAKMSAIGTGLIIPAAAVGVPIVLAVQQAAEFKSSMTDIALKTGMSAAAADQMGQRIEALAPKVGQLPEALMAGVDLLAGKGMDTAAAERMIRPIGMAASAAKAELRDLSAASYAAYSNLRVAERDAGAALDAMYVAGKSGAVELKDMARFFPVLGASYAALKQQGVPAVADLAAALQVAEKGTGDADKAATNLNAILLKMNTQDTVKNFQKMGVDLPKALKKAAADGKTPLEAIAAITDRALKGDLSRISYLFGDQEAQAGVRAMIQNMEEYRRIRAAAMAGKGSLAQDFARRDAGGEFVNPRWQAEVSRFKNLAGNMLLPTVNALLERFGALAGGMTKWANAHPELAKWLAIVVGGLVAVGAGISLLMTVFGPVVSGFAALAKGAMSAWPYLKMIGPFAGRALPFLRTFGGIFGWIARAVMIAATAIAGFVGLPVWLVAALGIAIAAAGVLIYRNWDRIKQAFAGGLVFLRSLWGSFREAGANIVRGIASGIVSMFGEVKSRIMALGRNAVGWFKSVLGIKSPSRVFAQLGQHMMGGLALGVDRGVERPLARVRAAGIGLTRAMAIGTIAVAPVAARPATAPSPARSVGASAGTVAGGAPITIQIMQQPGESADALADRVVRKLEAAKRAQRTSSYEDLD